jgi:hypothetical protein
MESILAGEVVSTLASLIELADVDGRHLKGLLISR